MSCKKNVVVSLFDYTGNMLKPWAKAGYDCYAIDIRHKEDYINNGIRYMDIDLSTELDMFDGNDIAFVSAFPPCTHLAVSGARWFKGKGLRKLADSINLFATATEFCESVNAPYIIENPVSTISTYWRKPDYSFHPWQYSGIEPKDNYTKKTCLWTGGGFVMPEYNIDDSIGKPDDRIHKAPPSPDRGNFRSATPLGFAEAVFQANQQVIKLS